MPYTVPRPYADFDPMAFSDAYNSTQDRMRQNRLADMQEQLARQKMEEQTQGRNALSAYIRGPQTDDELAGLAAVSPTMAVDQQKFRAVQGDKELRRLKEGLEYGLMVLPHVPFELYPAFRQDLLGRNMPAQMLPESFGSKEEYDAWRRQAQVAGADLDKKLSMRLKELQIDEKLADRARPDYGQPIETQAGIMFPDKKTGTLHPTGQFGAKKGSRIQLNDGTVIDLNGGVGGVEPAMQKSTINEVEKDLKQATDYLSQSLAIQRAYSPELQQVPWKAKTEWEGFKAKWMGQEPPPEERQRLNALTAHRQTAGRLFNQILKDMSGGAVTPGEATRQELVLPKPGTNVFDGDDPPTFEEKTRGFINFQRRAIARLNFYRKRGFSIKNAMKATESGTAVEGDPSKKLVELFGPETEAELGQMMNERGAEIAAEIEQKTGKLVGSTENKEAAKKQLAEEFGLVY